MMGKISMIDKMRIRTLWELGLGYKAITKKYRDKQWNLQSISTMCRRIDQQGSTTQQKPGSGRPWNMRTAETIKSIADLLCSQDQPDTSESTQSIASDPNISEKSVRRIAKHDLTLSAFNRMPAQVINAATKQKRLEQCKRLLNQLSMTACKRVFFRRKGVLH